MIRPGDRIGDAVQLDDGAFILAPDAVTTLIGELTDEETHELHDYMAGRSGWDALWRISDWLIRHFNIRVRIN